MQEMNLVEINEVSGAVTGGQVMMTMASAWSGAVAGAAFGSIVPGAGTLGGAAFGFAFGAATGIAALYAMDQ